MAQNTSFIPQSDIQDFLKASTIKKAAESKYNKLRDSIVSRLKKGADFQDGEKPGEAHLEVRRPKKEEPDFVKAFKANCGEETYQNLVKDELRRRCGADLIEQLYKDLEKEEAGYTLVVSEIKEEVELDIV